MAFLEIYTGSESGRQFQLGSQMSLGRDSTNDIVIADSRVSRCHARITRRGDAFFLEDLNSANGTFVGDEQLSSGKPTELVEGDVVRIGATRLIFRLYRFISSSSEIPRPAAAWLPNPPR